MDEAQAIAIARIAVEPYAKVLDGFESARFISPAQIVRESLEKGVPESQIPACFRTRKDFWAIGFRFKIPPGQGQCPSTLFVDVDVETGTADIPPLL